MTKSIEFYFDFSSPYSFIGYKEIRKYEKKNLFKIKYMPIFLGGFTFNSYFPIKTVNFMRGVIIAEQENFEKIYIEKIFNAIWRDGLNMNDPTVVNKVFKNIDLNPKIFVSKITDQKIKDKLKKITDNALKKGIFGAPTFVINKKIFWGQDRLHYAVEEAKK